MRVAPRLRVEPEVLEAEANRLLAVGDRVGDRSLVLGDVSIGQDSFGLVNLPLALAFDRVRDGLVGQVGAHAKLVTALADAVTALARDMSDTDSRVACRLDGRAAP
ncbi:hypothetical protein [Nocardioides daphniae]|uniref:Uncharacterized protein n=1 Tax=Nocardioides daphniae TaxID=402297 RepID=A0A4P7UD36_9ACTN|nr:hypothetical protein [Nocardioides daphniae]QCC78130.1 hypothetical protein E2C04_14765 [Nocardioides daphniae]GGD21666.1 hypothetical protein GCM10007231_21090 [Nocardioides daphniae]